MSMACQDLEAFLNYLLWQLKYIFVSDNLEYILALYEVTNIFIFSHNLLLFRK